MASQLPSEIALLPDGAYAESFPRRFTPANGAALATGRIRCAAVWMLKGWAITAARFFAGTTAGAGITHSWVGVWHHDDGELVGVTDDDTAATWVANSARTFGFAEPLLVPRSALYWVGLCVAAATVPSSITQGATANAKPIAQDQAPALVGATSATFTTPGTAPDPLAIDVSVSVALPYCVVL